MANTSVILVNDEGIYVPNTSSVTVNTGDTVTFATSDGSVVQCYFSPAAAAILSPAPGNAFSLSSPTSFTFTSSEPGAYSAFFGVQPDAFPEQVSQSLLLEISSGNPIFNGPGGGLRRGS
jgi:hypothetical protein